MPNKNYRAGRAFEYEVMNIYRELGYAVIRASGSHGEYDVIAYKPSERPKFIQCKRVGTEVQGKALAKEFQKITVPSKYYTQIMAIKIKGVKRPKTVVIASGG